MIKFFRHIRHRLFYENRFTKYIVYALGEIILVVIGILIALQINNWNEEQKEIQRERALLTYVLENLNTDATSIDSMISWSDQIFKVHENLIKFSKAEIQAREVGNINLLRVSEPHQTVTKKNHPNLGNEVRDQKLKESIQDYFLAIDWIEFTVKNNNDIIENQVRPFLGEKKLLNYGSQLSKAPDKLDYINSEKFFKEFEKEELRQVLFESGVKLKIMYANAKRLRSINKDLEELIEEYLKRK